MADELEVSTNNLRLYIVGDIHGRSDLLDRIVDEINRDIEEFGSRESLAITLGDYVDRGPDSRGVLDRLSRNPFPTEYIALKGNHEVMFESFLYHNSNGAFWRERPAKGSRPTNFLTTIIFTVLNQRRQCYNRGSFRAPRKCDAEATGPRTAEPTH